RATAAVARRSRGRRHGLFTSFATDGGGRGPMRWRVLEHSRVSLKHDRHQQVTHHEAINLIICRDAQEGIAMANAQDVAARDTAAPVAVTDFEAEADIVVVGGGGGGLPSALFSRW